jgi:hypothetical protein
MNIFLKNKNKKTSWAELGVNLKPDFSFNFRHQAMLSLRQARRRNSLGLM